MRPLLYMVFVFMFISIYGVFIFFECVLLKVRYYILLAIL
ncbi:hypothetical protein XIS1_660013 [Xenorhabdus innexi]|uniref:Uncharacterized protein n=1 Tax=Xenorhabdus innexi TaxID=290109 RepID=A0A1N6N060_9GAMM|nr:hypothetical protein XIS1_660013 [Xenorhabdus innexi]